MDLPHEIGGKDHPSLHDRHDTEVIAGEFLGNLDAEFSDTSLDGGAIKKDFERGF